jgi:tetratricopeptide (TPR) repeat protein
MKRFLVLLALAVSAFAPQQISAQVPPSASDTKKLIGLEKAYKAAKAAYFKSPKNAALKKRYVNATVVFGHESMVSTALPPRTKYKQALRLYREALKLDPKNPVAKPESELIINIYKQMGRPIPQ